MSCELCHNTVFKLPFLFEEAKYNHIFVFAFIYLSKCNFPLRIKTKCYFVKFILYVLFFCYKEKIVNLS